MINRRNFVGHGATALAATALPAAAQEQASKRWSWSIGLHSDERRRSPFREGLGNRAPDRAYARLAALVGLPGAPGGFDRPDLNSVSRIAR